MNVVAGSLVETMEGYLHRLMIERAELRRDVRRLDEEIVAVEHNLEELKTLAASNTDTREP